MALQIAMEFKHSIIRAALRQESVVQVKTVIGIALLAPSRKFIILDSALLGIVYPAIARARRPDAG